MTHNMVKCIKLWKKEKIIFKPNEKRKAYMIVPFVLPFKTKPSLKILFVMKS